VAAFRVLRCRRIAALLSQHCEVGGAASRRQLSSPALIVALAALGVALTGTAIAADIVPLAARARVADNAKKLGGKTPAQVARMPGPATTLNGKTADQIASTPGPTNSAAGAVVYKQATQTLKPAEIVDTTTACDAGAKAIGGGFQGPADNLIVTYDSRPNAEGTAWRLRLASYDADDAQVTLVAVCLK
jgi:hypothetical protein